MRYFDAHTHVQFAAFKDDWREVINRALESGVFLINVGTQQDTSRRAVEIANEYKEGMYATVGLHPIHTEKSYHDPQELGAPNQSPPEADTVRGSLQGFTSRGEEFDYEYYKKLALEPKVVAIGECGLDYFRIRNNELGIKKKQKEGFAKQIKLAHEIGKPLMIHCRDAFSDLLDTLIHNSKFLIQNNPGIIHFFSGTKEDAKKLLDLGFSFTFGGVITFVRDYDEVVRYIPLDRILSETDAPYVAPVPYRGGRNEPAYVIEVVRALAEIRNANFDTVRGRLLENTLRIFNLSI